MQIYHDYLKECFAYHTWGSGALESIISDRWLFRFSDFGGNFLISKCLENFLGESAGELTYLWLKFLISMMFSITKRLQNSEKYSVQNCFSQNWIRIYRTEFQSICIRSNFTFSKWQPELYWFQFLYLKASYKVNCNTSCLDVTYVKWSSISIYTWKI